MLVQSLLSFEQKRLNLLKIRGNAMQNAVPKDEGGMIAVLGLNILIKY